jgi:hypothetical protein
VLRAHVAEIFEISRKTVRAILAGTFSAPVLLHERGCIDHEQGMSAKYHILRKWAERRFVARASEGVGTVVQAYIMVAWHIVHRERWGGGEDRMEARDILLVTTRQP